MELKRSIRNIIFPIFLSVLLGIAFLPDAVLSWPFFKLPRSIFVINSPFHYLVNSKVRDQMFKVYWNSPTFQCRPHGILFDDIFEKYGIRQNEKDSFRGNEIALLYDPGKFPALLKDPNTNDYFYRNGGVPQEGNLDEHLKTFIDHLLTLIPDENFNGVGVIDFESWRPVFRQNFGSLQPYKDVSYQIENNRHPLWSQSQIEQEASRRFETEGRKFMEETLKIARKLRPLAKWGYYAFPYCFNMNNGNKEPNCANNIKQENDKIQWLWNGSNAIFPSVYLPKDRLNAKERLQLIQGRVTEAKRVASKTSEKPLIFPYMWYKYQDVPEEFITEDDLFNGLDHMKKSGLAGAIIWGSSNDVNSKDRCLKLREYMDTVIGPVVQQFVAKQTGKSDLEPEIPEETYVN